MDPNYVYRPWTEAQRRRASERGREAYKVKKEFDVIAAAMSFVKVTRQRPKKLVVHQGPPKAKTITTYIPIPARQEWSEPFIIEIDVIRVADPNEEAIILTMVDTCHFRLETRTAICAIEWDDDLYEFAETMSFGPGWYDFEPASADSIEIGSVDGDFADTAIARVAS